MAAKVIPASSIARNRPEYERRINRVVDYVSRNLEKMLSLEKLADVAAFSPFHFHRVFKAHTGESLSNFIQRIRLEKAARLLLRDPRRDITQIALSCGFASSSSFAHAFQKPLPDDRHALARGRRPGSARRKAAGNIAS